MRRKGYGKEALYLMEKNAAEAGCQECVLFVADGNIAAQALYKKCGYRVLRQESYGKYMIKKLQ
jgi:RimJ/RimL family protein N-acetyltransferase